MSSTLKYGPQNTTQTRRQLDEPTQAGDAEKSAAVPSGGGRLVMGPCWGAAAQGQGTALQEPPATGWDGPRTSQERTAVSKVRKGITAFAFQAPSGIGTSQDGNSVCGTIFQGNLECLRCFQLPGHRKW